MRQCALLLLSVFVLTWQAHSEPGIQYRVFYAPGQAPFDYSKPAYDGSNNWCVIPIKSPHGRYRFVARAYNAQNVESADSAVGFGVVAPVCDLDDDGDCDGEDLAVFGLAWGKQ